MGLLRVDVPSCAHVRPRWESEVGIPTSVGRIPTLQPLAKKRAAVLPHLGVEAPTVPRVLDIRPICAVWVSQGNPQNLHSPPGPCMGLTRQPTELYTIRVASQHVPNVHCVAIVHIGHIARSPESVGGSVGWRVRAI